MSATATARAAGFVRRPATLAPGRRAEAGQRGAPAVDVRDFGFCVRRAAGAAGI